MQCIGESFHRRMSTPDKIILIQLNDGFIKLAMNLICSILKVGIPKGSIQIWAMDESAHEAMLKHGIYSYFEPTRFFGTGEVNRYHTPDYFKMMRQRGKASLK
jgi:hypothetical protein